MSIKPFSRRTLDKRGDTIVEVMIVLAVLGLAIGISYATANRSLLNARQAQENAQATALAQSQLEALRSLTCGSGNINCAVNPTLFSNASPYCINTQANPYTVVPITDVNNYPAACQVGNIPYKISVNYANTATTPDTFTVSVTWPDVLSEGQDSVTLVYRLHQ